MSNRALVVIDLQNDYFSGGKWELFNIDAAAENAKRILERTRSDGDLVIHVHHEFNNDAPPFFVPGTEGAEIHSCVTPQTGGTKVLKHQVNAFHETNLKAILDENGIEQVTIIGAMSHMCIDSAARSASDFGYDVTVVEDACASRDLDFEDKTVPASDVHSAYMSALGFAFANVTTTQSYLN